jgi:hypothetical protein
MRIQRVFGNQPDSYMTFKKMIYSLLRFSIFRDGSPTVGTSFGLHGMNRPMRRNLGEFEGKILQKITIGQR